MSIGMMLSMMAQGMIKSFWIFAFTLILSLPLGIVVSFWTNVKKRGDSHDCESVHIDHERDTVDLTTDVYLFWKILCTEDADDTGVDEHRSNPWICVKLCRLFCGNLSWRN